MYVSFTVYLSLSIVSVSVSHCLLIFSSKYQLLDCKSTVSVYPPIGDAGDQQRPVDHLL